eukprot:CAMPEP_0194703516 /NCGR_PEP_ID=MMETSP0295-20121207/27637_1 /TAXON_ID=39354 /ORGANISM="Heterosigma akashiwo, Strain CCMP2393" /LENGTH=162 /DNA_ID=CAMNT_0039598531 /DNA_START=93 /DNA_END=579 /DNA_ORIENTATION=-
MANGCDSSNDLKIRVVSSVSVNLEHSTLSLIGRVPPLLSLFLAAPAAAGLCVLPFLLPPKKASGEKLDDACSETGKKQGAPPPATAKSQLPPQMAEKPPKPAPPAPEAAPPEGPPLAPPLRPSQMAEKPPKPAPPAPEAAPPEGPPLAPPLRPSQMAEKPPK